MGAIFVSHSSKDAQAADDMARWLRAQGYDSLFRRRPRSWSDRGQGLGATTLPKIAQLSRRGGAVQRQLHGLELVFRRADPRACPWQGPVSGAHRRQSRSRNLACSADGRLARRGATPRTSLLRGLKSVLGSRD